MKTNTIGLAFAVVTILTVFGHYYLGLNFIFVLLLLAITSTVYSMLKQLPAIAWWLITTLSVWLYLGGNL